MYNHYLDRLNENNIAKLFDITYWKYYTVRMQFTKKVFKV